LAGPAYLGDGLAVIACSAKNVDVSSGLINDVQVGSFVSKL
jgi:hypothetical protein